MTAIQTPKQPPIVAHLALALLALAVMPNCLATTAEDKFWNSGLRESMFADQPITESDEVIALTAPKRAEDGAVVPISIAAGFPQSEDRYIKTITLVIDRNPVPFAGKFTFTPLSGRADLAMRVRVNAYTPIRAIAETSDGKLFMSRRFVKASGGCSAPAGTDLKVAMQRLGKMKLTTTEEEKQLPSSPTLAQLRISHPNLTGMQMDQVTRLYTPAHFVRTVEVSFDGKPVLTAETDIAISENPSFRFYFVPQQKGELVAKVIDSKGQEFSTVLNVPTSQ
jgi:sulfur-oxidizing protein SoxY